MELIEFTLRKVSDWEYSQKLKLSCISELKDIQEKYNKQLIIDFTRMTITIYDDWIE